MFNKIKQMIKKRNEDKKNKNKLEYDRKFYEIRGVIIKFYEYQDSKTGQVEIPAFKRADNTLKQIIKNRKDIDYYYNKLLKYKAVA